MHGPQQGRGTVARRFIDIGMSGDQRAHRLEISVFRRNNDCGIARCVYQNRGKYRRE
jgi:hypothetical protein